jgi:hypothetical protein
MHQSLRSCWIYVQRLGMNEMINVSTAGKRERECGEYPLEMIVQWLWVDTRRLYRYGLHQIKSRISRLLELRQQK